MCGDAMEWCFAARVPPDLLQFVRDHGATSSAAPILGAHTFYVFQLWDAAWEVFGVLKECAIDAGDPGTDWEFGLGIPTAICATIHNREVQAAGASLSVGRGSAVVSSLLAGPGGSLSRETDVSLAFSPMQKAPDLFAPFSTIAAGKTLQLGRTTLSALTGVGYAPLGMSSHPTRPEHSLFAEAGVSREVHSRKKFSLSLLAAAGAERGPINTVAASTSAIFKHRSFSSTEERCSPTPRFPSRDTSQSASLRSLYSARAGRSPSPIPSLSALGRLIRLDCLLPPPTSASNRDPNRYGGNRDDETCSVRKLGCACPVAIVARHRRCHQERAGCRTAHAHFSPLSDRSYCAIFLRSPFQQEHGNASHASTNSLGAYLLGLALDAVVPHISGTRPYATSARGTILGPFLAFQVLSNGPDHSRLLSNGTRGTFAITHISD